MNSGEIKDWAVRNRPKIVRTLSELISIPTENPPGKSYEACVAAMGRFLSERKIAFDIIKADGEAEFPRFSILGSTECGDPVLHFHGHYDVVPAQSPEQFKAQELNGMLIGRGSSDMKGGLVAMLYALQFIKEARPSARGSVTFSIAPDEETGGRNGTRFLAENELLPKPALGMLMPEPTSGAIWSASKGALSLKILIKGKEAHVGLASQGVNAFEHMTQVAHSLLELKSKVVKRETALNTSPPEARRSVMLVGGQAGSGENFNVVPGRAFFTVDRRINPEETLADAKQEILAVLEKEKKKGIDLEVEVLQEGESSRAGETTELASTLGQAVEEVTGRRARFELCPGLLETRFFIERGIPAYAYGPGILEASHKPDEYVQIAEVLNCTTIYALTVMRVIERRE